MLSRSFVLFFCSLVLFTHCTRQPTSSPRDMSGKPKVGLSPNATLRPAMPGNDQPRRIEILFLGDNGHHKPLERVPQLMAALGNKGINITYTDQLSDLNTSNLAKYDGLLIYANWDSIPKLQERALIDFVASGKGLIPVHCASYCFRNSAEYVDKVVGGQFFRHKMDTIRTRFTGDADAITAGLEPFSAFDETYIHSHLQADNHVLAVRPIKPEQANDMAAAGRAGQADEPYTWTRTYGKGRVFYTAYGHDERTWSKPGFQQLLERGILWAVGDAVKKLHDDLNPQPFAYGEARLPNYEKRSGPQLRQQPLSPEESIKHIQVPVDFTLDLFAHEPNVMHPIAMAWDERGRLYVLITKDYPNERKPTGGSDSIVICEDTNGDGKADKFTPFAEGLSIPTGLVFANGGLIVSQAPDMLFLQDTDGDDRADVRKVLFTGFGTFDTHAGPSNLHYGFDNWIWATVGYSGFKGKVGADSLNFGQAFFRFKPDGSQMEMMTRTNNNTWGLGLRETGEVFGSTANNAHGWYMAIPSRYFSDATAHGYNTAMNGSRNTDTHKDMKPITDRVRQVDVFGGFTAAAGHNFYTARQFPKAYWNTVAFVCEPTGHIVHQNVMRQQGTDFEDIEPTSGIGFNLMAGADEWFAPVFAETGPDGAVWVADWYSYIIQHNPTPAGFENGPGNAYQTDLRDYTHGRIYRVAAKNAGEQVMPKLSKTDPAGLLAALHHPNLFWRTTAQRLLVERGQRDVLPQLVEMVKDTTRDEVGNSPASLHALWTLAGLGVFTDSPGELSSLYPALAHHPAPSVRRSTLQLMPKNSALVQAVMQFQTQNDPAPLVSLETLLTLSQVPLSPDATRAVLSQLQNATPAQAADRWLPDAYAALLTANNNQLLNRYLQMVSTNQEQKTTTHDAAKAHDHSAMITPETSVSSATSNVNPGAKPRQTSNTEPRTDLVITAIRTTPVSPVVREGTRIFVDVKNQGSVSLPAGTVVPLALKIEGGTGMAGSPKIEYISVKHDKGLAPGETVTIQQGNNGPWNADFQVTMEKAGPYTITATIDRQNQIQESDETNNTATHTLLYRAPARLATFALERAARSYAAHQPADSVVNLLRLGQRIGGDDLSALVKGAAEGWNPKQKATLSTDNQTFLVSLKPTLPDDGKARLSRLSEAFGLKTIETDDPTVQVIRLTTVREEMRYSQKEFTVVAGRPVVLVLENPDAMQHNLVIGNPKSMEIIGLAADKMITTKDGAEKNYVPTLPQILVATPLINPGQSYRLAFTAPATPGDYPFVCTFPGHWRIMNGVMRVK